MHQNGQLSVRTANTALRSRAPWTNMRLPGRRPLPRATGQDIRTSHGVGRHVKPQQRQTSKQPQRLRGHHIDGDPLRGPHRRLSCRTLRCHREGRGQMPCLYVCRRTLPQRWPCNLTCSGACLFFFRGANVARHKKPSSQHQWSSGRIHRCHRCDPGSIPG